MKQTDEDGYSVCGITLLFLIAFWTFLMVIWILSKK